MAGYTQRIVQHRLRVLSLWGEFEGAYMSLTPDDVSEPRGLHVSLSKVVKSSTTRAATINRFIDIS